MRKKELPRKYYPFEKECNCCNNQEDVKLEHFCNKLLNTTNIIHKKGNKLKLYKKGRGFSVRCLYYIKHFPVTINYTTLTKHCNIQCQQ